MKEAGTSIAPRLTVCAAFAAAAAVLTAASVAAQDDAAAYRKAAESIETDLAAALDELAAVRAEVAAERPALASESAALAAELRDRQRRAALASQERDALVHDLQSLSHRLRGGRDERAYIDSLLGEFRKQFETDIPLAEAEAIRETLTAADSEGEDRLAAQLAIARAAIARLAAAGGARSYPGEAIDEDGTALEGTFAVAGPAAWFVSDDGDAAGIAAANRALRPEIVPGTAEAETIRNLAANREAAPAFDPTMGTAIALGEAEDSFLDHVRAGGFWIIPILLLAVIAAGAAGAKWLQLVRVRPVHHAAVRRILEFLEADDPDAARAELRSVRHPAGDVLARGIELRGQPRADVEEALYEKFLEAQPALHRGLPLIAIASATAPLLGLLGTVTGMIHTFRLINLFGTGDARSLSSGISEALVTTEFGLAVAIPALIVHALLSRKVQGIRASMEMTSLAFINGLPAEPTRSRVDAPAPANRR